MSFSVSHIPQITSANNAAVPPHPSPIEDNPITDVNRRVLNVPPAPKKRKICVKRAKSEENSPAKCKINFHSGPELDSALIDLQKKQEEELSVFLNKLPCELLTLLFEKTVLGIKHHLPLVCRNWLLSSSSADLMLDKLKAWGITTSRKDASDCWKKKLELNKSTFTSSHECSPELLVTFPQNRFLKLLEQTATGILYQLDKTVFEKDFKGNISFSIDLNEKDLVGHVRTSSHLTLSLNEGNSSNIVTYQIDMNGTNNHTKVWELKDSKILAGRMINNADFELLVLNNLTSQFSIIDGSSGKAVGTISQDELTKAGISLQSIEKITLHQEFIIITPESEETPDFVQNIRVFKREASQCTYVDRCNAYSYHVTPDNLLCCLGVTGYNYLCSIYQFSESRLILVQSMSCGTCYRFFLNLFEKESLLQRHIFTGDFLAFYSYRYKDEGRTSIVDSITLMSLSNPDRPKHIINMERFEILYEFPTCLDEIKPQPRLILEPLRVILEDPTTQNIYAIDLSATTRPEIKTFSRSVSHLDEDTEWEPFCMNGVLSWIGIQKQVGPQQDTNIWIQQLNFTQTENFMHLDFPAL